MNPITIRGNEINESVLREVRRLLISPTKRVATVTVLSVYACVTLVAIQAGLWGWLPVFAAFLLFFLVGLPYMRQERVIAKMLEIMRKTYGRPCCAFDVTLEESCVRSVNVRTRETVRVPYEDFVKMAQTKSVVAIVSRHGYLIVLDRAKAGEENLDAALEIIRQRCTNLQFR